MTPFYDPLISKVIVHADTREEAIEKSKAFFSESRNRRVENEYTVIQQIPRSEEFVTGDYTTAVLPIWLEKQKEEIKK